MDRASANRALLWSRYRRDHQDDRHDDMSGQSQQAFKFAALPSEIRREVYCWLLRQSCPVIHCPSKDVATEYKQPVDLRILAVSHALYSEALAVFLEKNVVKMFGSAYFMGVKIQSVDVDSTSTPLIRSRMTTVLIQMTYEKRRSWHYFVTVARILCSKLSRLPNLKTLKVEFCYEGFLAEHETERFEREILDCFDGLKSCGNFATQIESAYIPASALRITKSEGR